LLPRPPIPDTAQARPSTHRTTVARRNEPVTHTTLPLSDAYRFAVARRSGYLHVSVSGENTAGNVRRILRDVLDACAQHHCRRVLLQEHLSGPSLEIVEAFEIVSEGSRSARPIEQIAYVDTNPEHDSSLNRGVRVRVFAAVSEAESWLEAEISKIGATKCTDTPQG
jgi:hypothetical protein